MGTPADTLHTHGSGLVNSKGHWCISCCRSGGPPYRRGRVPPCLFDQLRQSMVQCRGFVPSGIIEPSSGGSQLIGSLNSAHNGFNKALLGDQTSWQGCIAWWKKRPVLCDDTIVIVGEGDTPYARLFRQELFTKIKGLS